MKNNSKKSIAKILLALMIVFALAIPMTATVFATDDAMAISEDAAVLTIGAADAETAFSVEIDGEATDYDLTDGESAAAYVDSYADNLTNDPGFKAHIETALAKVRESIGSYATIAALAAPVIAIVLALITKEVYSSLIIGIVVGTYSSIFGAGSVWAAWRDSAVKAKKA